MCTLTTSTATIIARRFKATVKNNNGDYKFYVKDSAKAWKLEDLLDAKNYSNASVNA